MALTTKQTESLNRMNSRAKGASLGDAIFSMQPKVRTLRITSADLAALGAKDTQAFNIGAALPDRARLLGFEVLVGAAFDDGGAHPTVTVSIGTDPATSPTDVMEALTVANGAVSGTGVAGIKGKPMTNVSEAQFAATLTTNNAAHLAGLDAGDITINVFYSSPIAE